MDITEAGSAKSGRGYKRRSLLIRNSIQTKYALLMLLVFLVAAGAVWVEIYQHIGAVADEGALTDPLLRESYLDFSKRLAVKVVVMLAGVGLLSVMALHLVAGPIYRLEGAFKSLRDGNLRDRVFLRKDDQLKNTAAAYNDTVGALSEMVKRDREALEAVIRRLESARSEADGATAAEIDAAVEALRRVTKDFVV